MSATYKRVSDHKILCHECLDYIVPNEIYYELVIGGFKHADDWEAHQLHQSCFDLIKHSVNNPITIKE